MLIAFKTAKLSVLNPTNLLTNYPKHPNGMLVAA